MKILFITHEIPVPLDNGDRIYTFNILKVLLLNGHKIDLLAYEKDPPFSHTEVETQLFKDQLQENGAANCLGGRTIPFQAKSPARAFWSRYPGMITNRRSQPFIDAVNYNLEHNSYDIVIVNHFKMCFVIEAIKQSPVTVPSVHISHNAETLLSRSVYSHHRNLLKKIAFYLDWKKMAVYEPHLLRKFDGVSAISDVDGNFFRKNYGLNNVTTLPPGVDLNDLPTTQDDSPLKRKVIVCGSFLWEPKKLNLESLLNCDSFRNLAKNNIELLIVGNADQKLVGYINRTYSKVTMTGWVEDVGKYYQDCSVALIPEKMGGGVKLKIIEAALKLKAIIGLQGSVAAPGFIKGEHFLEARNFDEMIDLTIKLVNDPALCHNLVTNTLELLKKDYLWDNIYTNLNNFLTDAVMNNPKRVNSK